MNTEASLEWHQGVFLVFFCKMPLWAGSNERCLAHRILKLRIANNRTMFSMLFRQVVKTIKLPVKVNVSNKKNILYHVQLQQLRKIKWLIPDCNDDYKWLCSLEIIMSSIHIMFSSLNLHPNTRNLLQYEVQLLQMETEMNLCNMIEVS